MHWRTTLLPHSNNIFKKFKLKIIQIQISKNFLIENFCQQMSNELFSFGKAKFFHLTKKKCRNARKINEKFMISDISLIFFFHKSRTFVIVSIKFIVRCESKRRQLSTAWTSNRTCQTLKFIFILSICG